jgi:hypothetical protein
MRLAWSHKLHRCSHIPLNMKNGSKLTVLYNLSFTSKHVWIEDIYNGLLATKIPNITLNDILEFFYDLNSSDYRGVATEHEVVNATFFASQLNCNNLEMYIYGVLFMNIFSPKITRSILFIS